MVCLIWNWWETLQPECLRRYRSSRLGSARAIRTHPPASRVQPPSARRPSHRRRPTIDCDARSDIVRHSHPEGGRLSPPGAEQESNRRLPALPGTAMASPGTQPGCGTVQRLGGLLRYFNDRREMETGSKTPPRAKPTPILDPPAGSDSGDHSAPAPIPPISGHSHWQARNRLNCKNNLPVGRCATGYT